MMVRQNIGSRTQKLDYEHRQYEQYSQVGINAGILVRCKAKGNDQGQKDQRCIEVTEIKNRDVFAHQLLHTEEESEYPQYHNFQTEQPGDQRRQDQKPFKAFILILQLKVLARQI